MKHAAPLAAIGKAACLGARAFACALLASFATTALAQGTLENPQPAGFESGIGLVSGWHCNAGQIQVVADFLFDRQQGPGA